VFKVVRFAKGGRFTDTLPFHQI